MTGKQNLFENYLTRHLSHVGGAALSKQRKSMLSFNYEKLFRNDPKVRILEIGPGYGELIELLVKDYGCEQVQAIDMSQEVVDFCNEIVPGSTTYVEDTHGFLSGHVNQFDYIFLLHVLEHVPKEEIIPLLRAILEALTPQGKLIVEVPNMANPFIGLNIRYADFTHEAGFNELSLPYVLAMAGFSEVRIFEMKVPLDSLKRALQIAAQIPLKLIVRLTYKAFGSPGGSILSRELYAIAVK